MPFETHELDGIKVAVSEAIAQHHQAFGLDENTAQAFGLVILAAVDAGALDPAIPQPFAKGTKVRVKGTGIQGVVVRTVETAGELHTVVVRLALDEGDVAPETPFSPRELEVLA